MQTVLSVGYVHSALPKIIIMTSNQMCQFVNYFDVCKSHAFKLLVHSRRSYDTAWFMYHYVLWSISSTMDVSNSCLGSTLAFKAAVVILQENH